ncbi:DUF6851 domain-containing protein [Lewinella sp. 4G2]|uniref:DUF6851 domain-containing protein n=1 Tax=Lewinella sp. 4G2 TaxID=1803372 RepID=UPI0007E1C540|nr:T9SS type A sorting domain-containing protein [Lewinella sp. 4G2]OAV46119.1 hypothetical protein A3850_017825 [Lewinella sp. 4G2]
MFNSTLRLSFTAILLALFLAPAAAQTDHSVARQWNEQVLEAIRNDFARPTVHARNLYHISAAMYDCWSLVHKSGTPALLNNDVLPIDYWLVPDYGDVDAAADEAVSFAAYRILRHRYIDSPGGRETVNSANALMLFLGYNPGNTSMDYRSGDPAALGNYVAEQIISFGLSDGANEANQYANLRYPAPFNPPLQFTNVFSIFQLMDPTRWQSLQFPGTVVDQSGNVISGGPLDFLSAEWGEVTPFAMGPDDRRRVNPDNQFGSSYIYHDPGPPALFTRQDTNGLEEYRWNFSKVLHWSSHLDPTDGVMWDISPGARGNLQRDFPTTFAEYRAFYLPEGGVAGSNGHDVNPVTGQPYPPNVVPRGDYARVLAEFWADGPDSETPPGHWFDIFNGVMDHPLFERKLYGQGAELPALEYDVKAYLTLGGAMHDAAISAWSIKGAYDYIRPISAIRWMASNGQCTDPDGANYSIFGFNLQEGLVEPLTAPGELQNSSLLAQVQARGWIGPDAISDPATDVAGVAWINPTLWYPYQRPNFVTPSFAGYVSGHSTFSAAAASVLEEVTGSAYFPGGVGEFIAEKDSFLVFEQGPSVTVKLQWATYRDAANETSLSRIWGGIHPPVDDAPGRRVGLIVADDAIEFARDLFAEPITNVGEPTEEKEAFTVYPNPVTSGDFIRLRAGDESIARNVNVDLFNAVGKRVRSSVMSTAGTLSTEGLAAGMYILSIEGEVAVKVIVR